MLVGLALVSLTGAEWLDPVVALIIAGAIVVTGFRITMGSLRVLVDEALPEDELDAIQQRRSSRSPAVASSAITSRVPAAPARAATSTCTCSSASGTSLEEAHHTAHAVAGRDHGARSAAPTSSSTSSPKTASVPAKSSEQIDRGGDGDAERHPR